MRNLKEIYQIFQKSKHLVKQQASVYTVSTLLMAFAAGAMTAMNFKREYYVMAVITTVLTSMFLLCAYLYGVRKMELLPSSISAACVILSFTYFAVSGQNQGFAILWILMIPLFGTSLFEMRIGLGVSIYFLILSMVLFYTPLRVYVMDYYTEAFIGRFPILYLIIFLISMFTFVQKELYSRMLYIQSNCDALTDTYNRSYFTNFVLPLPLPEQVNTCVITIDVNGLKNVNDTFGHEAGDELICAIPYCCHQGIASDFTLCRVGGDEFVLIVHKPEAEIAALANQIKDAGLYWKGKYSQNCKMSIGWASSSEYPQATMEELYQKADIAMYQDKAKYYQKLREGMLNN